MQNAIARSPVDLESVMATVVEHATSLTGASGAVVELIDGDSMQYRAASGSAAAFLGYRIARTGSLSGLCIAERTALYAADTAIDDRVDRVACERIGVASMVCVPLFHDGEPRGVLKVMSREPHAFADTTAATLELLADVIAASMHHAQEHEAAIRMSLHDGLTGLLNRRAFDRQLTQEIARAVRHRRPLSIGMFDLDGLKAANDSLGHAAGDKILRDAATALRETLRVNDGCFRLGGDELAAILPETNEDSARRAAGRCIAAVAAARLGGGRVGISAGVAELQDGETAAVFVGRADAALYVHKRRRRPTRSGPMKSMGKTTMRIRRAR